MWHRVCWWKRQEIWQRDIYLNFLINIYDSCSPKRMIKDFDLLHFDFNEVA